MKLLITKIHIVVLAILSVLSFTGCQEEEFAEAQGYGYVQFHLYKKGSTKAGNQLDYLHEAAKVRVTLRNSSTVLTPTLTINTPDDKLAEYGVQSEKLKLMSGEYTLVDYQIYDALDNPVLLGEPDAGTVIQIVPGGLVSQDLLVNVVERGWVKFQLTKDTSELIQSKAANDGADGYPFHGILAADVTVKNIHTGETTQIKGLETKFELRNTQNGETPYYTSVCTTDSLLSFRAGTYSVVGFRTYFDDSRRVFETSDKVAENQFVVKDNQETTADVPVAMHLTSGHISDAMTLREIWEALDGPNWKVKWNFDSDVDLWTAQPGVEILDNGRVASLNLEGTGASGDMPAAIGKLSELRALYLGSHSYDPGNSNINPTQELAELGRTDRAAFRRSFHETFVRNSDPMAVFPEEMHRFFKLNGNFKEAKGKLRELPQNNPNNYSNYVTSLPDELNDCHKLEILYIGYSPITRFPEDMSGLKALTDMEIFACPDLKTFPAGFATLPSIQSITFSSNYNVTSEELYKGLCAMNEGAAAAKLQGLYLLGQKLDRLPDMSKMEYLSVLNIQNCGITEIEAPFGKDHPFVEFLAAGNKISKLPVDASGFFIGQDALTETVEFAGNEFTEFPDIFDASEGIGLGTIDFSANKISSFGSYNGKYRGVNAQLLNLSDNRLKKFPVEIAQSKSVIPAMELSGNGMEEIEPEALEGENIYMINTLDLSFNKLKKLPVEFNRLTLPMLRGLDLSFNRFSSFPYTAIDNQNMQIFIFRHQRDENGNRIMRDWPQGIGGALAGLRALYLGSNDLRNIEDDLSYLIYTLDISDNPNISIDVSALCPYIESGFFELIYSPDQDIRGCDKFLNLNK